MDDLISRAAALDAIDGMKPMQGNMEQLVMKSLCYAAVKTIQLVDAAPVVHGMWIRQKGSAHVFKCSACGFVFAGAAIAKYCPNCGAKMDKEART